MISGFRSLHFLITLYVLLENVSVILSGKRPRVLLSVNMRNEETTLPTFLAYIEKLDYPKDQISILIQTDHNEDNTAKMVKEWESKQKHLYHSITVRHQLHPSAYNDTDGPNHYSKTRYLKLLQNTQHAFNEAKKQWVDYLFLVNAGNFLLNPNVLNELINENKTLISPMLQLFDPDSRYSNYWGGMDERGYYKRVPEYFDIFKRRKKGSFQVPMIHSTILVEIADSRTDKIQLYPVASDYQRNIDNTMVFAWAVQKANLTLHICNKNFYGFMMDLYPRKMSLKKRHQRFLDNFIDYLVYNPPLLRSNHTNHTFPIATKKGFDEVYMINLVRRPDRRIKMELACKELGLAYKYFPAVDGKNFTTTFLEDMGIKPMLDFKDPYLERPITFGEIGCFLSHWNIWLEMIERKLDMVLVLEDDIRFEPSFNEELEGVMREARHLLKRGTEWDILYLGRKPLNTQENQKWVYGCRKIVWAKYSYWTLGYVIRLSGAKQLVAGAPFSKMIPVDEYIPIKFNEHPNDELKKLYYPRDMIGLSAGPLILYPTHYVGEPGHFSDTEDTLSYEGEDVSHYRKEKLEQRLKEIAEEKAAAEKNRTALEENVPAKKEEL